ncbi:MAG: DUF2555 domain-containing protein [Cyanobacteria bacterium P01_G01_bin.54]
MTSTVTSPTRDFNAMTTEDVAQLANRLEQDDYNSPFAALEDWHLLRSIAFHNLALVEPYLYLLDIEPFDEA